MKHYLPLLVLIVVASCGRAPQQDMDADVASSRILFMATTTRDITTVPVTFEEIKLPTLGMCIHEAGGPRIVISKHMWPIMSKDVREHLMLHEFGHAIGLRHNNNTNSNNKPISIMFSTLNINNDEEYTRNKEYYLTQLKSASKQEIL